ncbi:MAG TPA: type I secretion C-terminal target domain-containing protein [Leptolyngbyaceae cyanobacterium]
MANADTTLVAPGKQHDIQNFTYNSATTSELTFNQSVSGSIDEQEEKNVFTFTGTAGQMLYYDALQSNLSDNVRVRLVDPLGNTIFLNEDADNDYPLYPSEFDQASLLTLTESGTYQLIVENNASDNFEPESYQFRLIDVASAPTLSLNEVTTLPSGNAAGLYRLTGVPETLRFETVGDEVPSFLINRWYAPDGQYVSALVADVNFPFTNSRAEGSILVVDVSTVPYSNYSFQVEPFVTPIQLNTSISGTYKPGEIYAYSFTGIAGQLLYYGGYIEGEGGSFSPSVTVYGENGNLYLSTGLGRSMRFASRLEQTRTYTLVVQSQYGEYESVSAEFSFGISEVYPATNLSLNTVVNETLPAGDPIELQYNFTGPQLLYNFTAQGSQKLIFDSLINGLAPVSWSLYTQDPFVLVARGGNIGSDFTVDVSPIDTDYALLIEGLNSTDVNLSFQVISIDSTDIINGTSERDTLIGSDANNLIIGSQGADVLTGGLGKDIFQYTSLVDGGDRITDFTVGSDKFELGQLLESLGYSGTDPIGEGYVQFSSRGRNGSSVNIDPDGFAGAAKARNFIFVENVDVASLSDQQNFLFL